MHIVSDHLESFASSTRKNRSWETAARANLLSHPRKKPIGDDKFDHQSSNCPWKLANLTK